MMDEQKFFDNAVNNQTFPKNDALKQIILKRIMKDFEENKIYKEEQINEIIKKYFEDFTLIRRELINFGYMQRNSLKGKYLVMKKQLTSEDYEKNTLLKRASIDVGGF